MQSQIICFIVVPLAAVLTLRLKDKIQFKRITRDCARYAEAWKDEPAPQREQN